MIPDLPTRTSARESGVDVTPEMPNEFPKCLHLFQLVNAFRRFDVNAKRLELGAKYVQDLKAMACYEF